MIKFLLTIFFVTFITFGGGSVFIPIFERMLVGGIEYFTVDEFSTVVAVVSSLPGIVGGRIAAYTGYYKFGWIGFCLAYLAFVLPGYAMMIIFYKLFKFFEDSMIMGKISIYIKPIVIGIFLYLIVYFFKITYFELSIIENIIIFLIAFILIDKYKVAPFFVIILTLIYSLSMYFL